MKINIHNYTQAEAKIDWDNASENLIKAKALTAKGMKNYEQSEPIKKAIDLYFQLLEKSLPGAKPAKKAVIKKAVIKKPAIVKTKPEVTKKVATPKPDSSEEIKHISVAHIPSDYALIKRYVGLHDKTKTYDQVLSVWRAFNKAIVEMKVDKDSPYKREIATMNKSLASALEEAKVNGTLHLVIPSAKLKSYREIAERVAKSISVSILIEYINISGKAAMQERGNRLLKRITKALDAGKMKGERLLSEVKNAKAALESYLNKETDVIHLNDYALNGIGNVAVFGCTCDKTLSGLTNSQNAVIYKLISEKVRNLQERELDRAFNDTIAPSLCKTIALKLIQTKQLTMALLRNPAKVSGGSLSLNGAANKNIGFDLNTEIMDMRLKNAAKKQSQPELGRIKRQGLSGLDEAVTFPVPDEEVKIMSAAELVNQHFKTMGLKGKYRKLIGDPEPGFSVMIYGKPKQGKSTVAIDMAKEFAQYGRALYCAYEEGHGYTLQDKVKRNNANVPNLDFANRLPSDLSRYQFVFVDSVSDAGLDERAFKHLIYSNKPTSIIGIFHATKDGKFRGGQTYAHDVDVLIKVENGVAEAQGRFAPPNQISIAAIANAA